MHGWLPSWRLNLLLMLFPLCFYISILALSLLHPSVVTIFPIVQLMGVLLAIATPIGMRTLYPVLITEVLCICGEIAFIIWLWTTAGSLSPGCDMENKPCRAGRIWHTALVPILGLFIFSLLTRIVAISLRFKRSKDEGGKFHTPLLYS